MYKPIEQGAVNKRINEFMSRKSPWKTFSKTVAEILNPSSKVKQTTHTGITYEALDWDHEPAARQGMRKLAS